VRGLAVRVQAFDESGALGSVAERDPALIK
jgi:hypothetical protein